MIFSAISVLFFFTLCMHQRDKVWRFFKRKTKRLTGPNDYIFGGYFTLVKLWDLGKLLETFVEWSRKYGAVFQFKLGFYRIISLNSPEMIQKLLSSSNSSHLSKPFIYDVLKPFLIDGLLLSRGDKWRYRRKAVNKHLFSYGTLLSYTKIFNEESDTLLKILEDRVKSNTDKNAMPIDDIMSSSSLNVISQIVLGKSLDFFAEANNANGENIVIDLVRKAKAIVTMKIFKPWLMFYPIWRLHPLYQTEKEALKLHRYVVERCTAPSEGNDEDFLFKKDLEADGVSPDGIIEEALAILVAGYETAASGIQFLLFFLALHPNHQDICRKEVDEIFGELENDFITISALKNLKYLEMCLYETFRILPPVPIFMRKLETPLELDSNLTLPTNSVVGIHVQAIHKNPKYYPNPEQFIPERFSEEERSRRHPYAYLAFSAGVRNCIGNKFAMMEMVLVAAKILRRYVVSTTDKLEDIVFLPHMTISMESPIKFLLEPRTL